MTNKNLFLAIVVFLMISSGWGKGADDTASADKVIGKRFDSAIECLVYFSRTGMDKKDPTKMGNWIASEIASLGNFSNLCEADAFQLVNFVMQVVIWVPNVDHGKIADLLRPNVLGLDGTKAAVVIDSYFVNIAKRPRCFSTTTKYVNLQEKCDVAFGKVVQKYLKNDPTGQPIK